LAGQPPVDARERFLHPGVLESLRLVNPEISPRIERAIFYALGMHPSERPATVRELREMLFGSKPLTQQQLSMTETHRLLLAASPSWQDLFYQNRVLVGVALALAVIAIIISLP
jgi:serine/threonine-protein kinase